ncbi:Serine/threonine-protein kinase SMG1 [Cyphomyrmex costatus]|uniref:non-specific serine/threonine protein kinase n=1 Tax=Cyphomyrmex costatus TaxID=456900 RepID=A0A195C7G7_9HYME|nr:Serine/threonine-protein kinase SMG1 [Cyphomyrmex costatus]
MNSCGNSNTSTRLRGSKCAETPDESINHGGEIEREDGGVISGYSVNDLIPRSTLVICQRNSNYSSDYGFARFKPRLSSVPRNEFRMARGGSSADRGTRGGTRGRAFKKILNDRESNSESSYHSTSRSKFQESLKNHENAQGKYYDDKRINEDSRISKLLRRLCREDDYDHLMVLCKQVQESIVAPENQRYIRRNLETICESLLDFLHSGPGQEAKQQVAKCLGRIGYVVEQDFKRYMDWIFNKYSLEHKDDVKCLLMKSLMETLKMDSEISKLKEFSMPMMSQLQSVLENVDRADLLVATVDAILLIIDSYPETFTNHFRDTVDILVGQFLEDMESYDEELNLPESGRTSPGDDGSPTPRECILRITSLISVFNTVTKSIAEHLNPNLAPNVQWSFLTNWQLLMNVMRSIAEPRVKQIENLSEEKEELIVVANECAFLLLGYLQSRVTKNHELLYKFIDLQLQRVNIFWDDTIISMLSIISKIIKEVSANLPLELVHTLLGKNSMLLKLRFRNSITIQNASLGVYHSLLSLKNIPLLQESYRYILADLEIAYKLILPDIDVLVADNPLNDLQYAKSDVEIVVTFVLRALSDIANASNSIIGMWALKPSILELLAVKLKPYDTTLSTTSPFLQYNILYLLYAHCSRYNHFVSSSSLITGATASRPMDMFPGTLDVPTTSPASGHLSIILNLIAKTYNKDTPACTLLLLSTWLQEICVQSEKYIGILSETQECQSIIASLVNCGATTNDDVASAACNLFEMLMTAKDVVWKQETYLSIVDLATLHLTSCNKTIREKYGALLMCMPINIVLSKLNKQHLFSDTKKVREIVTYSTESLILAQRLHMRSNNNGELLAQHFKTYMAFLLQEHYLDESGLSEIFTLCWPAVSENGTTARMYDLALANCSFLFFWSGFEAAQHCVLNKLRTSLGKPQETFTSIESALKILAREISCHNLDVIKKQGLVERQELDRILHEHTRVRLFVEFLEHLERMIHNAADGCAMALLPLSKPVRTFFHTNKSTCKEWLNRIRLALCVVSLHSGLATSALRNGQRLLEDLNNADNTQGIEFERATLWTTQAMVALGEAEALQGLYVYTKSKDRQFSWLKAAMEEAAGRYESAADAYKQIIDEHDCVKINDDESSRTTSRLESDSQVLGFCMQRLSNCYKAVSDWSGLVEWKSRETEMLTQDDYAALRKQIAENIVPQQADCLKKFEEGKLISLDELSNWNLLEKKSNWSCAKTLIACSNSLTNVALRIRLNEFDDSFDDSIIERCQKVAAKVMQDGLRNVPSEYLSDAILLQYSATGLKNIARGKKDKNVFDLYKVDKVNNINSNILTQVLWWSEYLDQACDSGSTEVDSLRLHVVRTARKEGNFNLAKREMVKYLKSEQDLIRLENPTACTFTEITSGMLNGPVHVKWTKSSMRAFRELSKLLYDMENTSEALRMCCVTALGISQAIVSGEQSTDLRETGTKLLLTLGKWIQQDSNVNENPQLEELLRFEAKHNDGLMDKLFGETIDLIPTSDMIIGKLMQLGVNQCPDLPRAWSSFAAWCYKWGRKIVDNSNSGQLTDTDRINIQSLLPMDIVETDLNAIFSILSQNKTIPEDEGDIDINDINTSDMIENQLRNVSVLSHAGNEHLYGMLVDIWRQAQKRIYSYYELSANAYFKYLQLANNDSNECDTITATLRLLRLVVKHALELQNVLEAGLSTTPTAPWKEIIPQLFSRLSHPEAYVRTQVSELLCRVAENSPHLITFPAVVGAVSGQKKMYDKVVYEKPDDNDSSQNDVDWEEEEDEEKIAAEAIAYNDEHESFMDSYFSQLVDCLSSRIQDSVIQVKVLVKELRRITLLWDELWLATLCQHHTEITKRFEQLEIEIQRVQDNIWLTLEEKDKLIAEKHRIILKPITFILENLLSMTSVPAETPHEKTFQEKFGASIEEVINRLNNPKNPAKPQIASLALKHLESKLAQRVHRRAAYSLSMTDISPILANLKDTRIAMPGVAAVDNRIITIMSVDNNVQILPTKTKPKKLIFHGSDGHVYTYLFKGLEDLHLDERIMQFLSICNTMMSKNSDTKVYRARHYSVIPLGPRSGLIQWVDGVTPLFILYKRWQQRECAVISKTGGGNSAIMRPSELFYNKLTPLLKECGIGLENRKEWPIHVLKKVLEELMRETPKDLLAKEIWCNSINAGSWWQATKNYSYSVAVMSIIGYIIGLGDRHLDNVLVDLNTGEVVHIDYNVCFEKGKTLRVPEKVPFRMTPNIKTALGVTGVEGIFRFASEHTLRVMRRGRETLLTLLEAFVYDPLVDWRAGADTSIASYGACQARARCTGVGRKQLEQELTRAMFAVRTAEMRTEWLANRDELAKTLPLLCHHLNSWIETTEASRHCQDLLQDRHQQLALVKEAQAIGRNHALYSLVKRYNSFKRARDSHEKAKAGLKERIEECEKQINMHNIALAAVRGSQLGQWLAELGNLTNQKDHVVFDLVKEFLQNAGQSQMIVQCEQSENELMQLATDQAFSISKCLELLSQYSAICNLYPLSILSQHRAVLYHTWASELLATGTIEACHEIMARFEASLNPINPNNPQVQQIITFSYQMEAILNESSERYKKAYERTVSQGLPEAGNRIEKAYAESRAQITGFLRREKGAEKAFECVNITALCSLNMRYLMMEGAAKCAGDCLVDLTSREGDWFLDDMRLVSSLIVEFITLIPESHKTNTDPKIALIFKCLRSADCIYKGLQDLNYNFQTIILPEAMKTIVTEEPSVMRMISELDEIIILTGIPLGDILAQLEMHLRFIVMEMESPHAVVQSIVNNIRLRFEALLSRQAEAQDLNQEESLTPGQMLLMGFNGLFEKVQMEGNALVAILSSLDIPMNWKKMDQIREAKEMSVPIFNKAIRQVLEDIFLIKRLHTIQEFFMMCRDIATAFKGGLANVYDDERLNKPVRLFTADYVSRQLLGVTTQTLAIALCFLLQRMGLNVTTEIEQRDIGAESKVSLEELCRKMVDDCLKRGLFSGSVFTQGSALNSTLESTWRRQQVARLAQQSAKVARISLQRLQLQQTAYHWLHEDVLMMRPNMNPMNPMHPMHPINRLNRSTFMLELRKKAAKLSNLQSRVCEAREQQQNLISSAVQRLKWAAGANPALGEVMSAFDNAVLSSCDKLTRQHNLAAMVVNTCNSILHYEALRTRTSESVTHDTNLVKLIKHWEESCLLTVNLNITVTMIEESLVQLLQLENNQVDATWLKQAEKMVSEAIIDTQKKLQEKQEALFTAEDYLRERVMNLQNVLAEHHRLMSDVRALLKTMAKQENIDGLQDFLFVYRSFTENISAVVKELEAENFDSPRGMAMKEELEAMAIKVPSLYNRLLEFASERKLNSTKGTGKPAAAGNLPRKRKKRKKGKLMRQNNVCLSPRKGTPLARDPTTGKAVQERNAYALNVWRRVRMKLEGRDPQPSRKYTTAEQVEYVIREAQSNDNLALLYEGWTPWV